MTVEIEKSLTEGSWVRARRDTWPSGWRKKVGKRVLVTGLALGANWFLREESDRGGIIQAAAVGLAAFLLSDLAVYPINVLLAPRRQRDELRCWANGLMSRDSVKVSIRAAVLRGRGDTKIINVSNPGDVPIRDVVVVMPRSDMISPVDWRSGEVVIEELRSGETRAVPFFLRRALGLKAESVRAEIRGVAGDGEHVEDVRTTVVIDPHQL